MDQNRGGNAGTGQRQREMVRVRGDMEGQKAAAVVESVTVVVRGGKSVACRSPGYLGRQSEAEEREKQGSARPKQRGRGLACL